MGQNTSTWFVCNILRHKHTLNQELTILQVMTHLEQRMRTTVDTNSDVTTSDVYMWRHGSVRTLKRKVSLKTGFRVLRWTFVSCFFFLSGIKYTFTYGSDVPDMSMPGRSAPWITPTDNWKDRLFLERTPHELLKTFHYRSTVVLIFCIEFIMIVMYCDVTS